MDKARIRQWVWDELTRTGQAAFPKPVHGRIPNFRGAAQAAARLRQLDVYQRARVVKVGPDAPLHPIRTMVLRDGKTLYMPTPRLAGGFVVLRDVPPGKEREATSLAHFKAYGREVPVTAIEPIDLVVAGSVAVDHRGVRVGKGEGYGDLEFALLCELGKLTPDTPVVTAVHDLQVVDSPDHPLGIRLPHDDHDIAVDVIVTPTRVIHTKNRPPQPSRIDWEKLGDRLEQLKPLAEWRRLQGDTAS
ncbi:MAG: 5-formyltetrahydrofolate cyclo-ligase [Calditerricola sp.]|nr:5-formyltetrahydrofolate cyclo-ligase [Calditerricola sp.]